MRRPSLRDALRSLLTPVPAPWPQPSWRSVVAVGAVALVLGTFMLGLQFARLGTDVTGPFFVGTGWKLDEEFAHAGARVKVVAGTGYDGQWFLGLAYDPFLTEGFASGFDMPRYRAGRPLYALVGWALAGGAGERAPYTLLAVGPLALALGAASTARLLAAHGRSRWWGLGFALIPGVVVGVTHGTAEPLGLACVALGLSLVAGSRFVLAGAAFAGGALTKETYLAFAAVAAGVLVLGERRRWREAAAVVLPGAVLLAGWSAYVALMVPPSAGDAKALDAVQPPGVGWVEIGRSLAAGSWVPDAPVGPFGQVMLVGSLVVSIAGIVAGLRRPSLAGWTAVALGGYALCVSSWVLSHFLSSMRALAPCLLAALLGLAVSGATPVRRRERDSELVAAAAPDRPAAATLRAEPVASDLAGGGSGRPAPPQAAEFLAQKMP
jgi:hypothetical protein